jgi:hypothetical protein
MKNAKTLKNTQENTTIVETMTSNSPTSYTISHKKVIDFYNRNPNLSIETMNCLLVDLLEQISGSLNNQITNSIASSILSSVTESSLKCDLSMKQNDMYFNRMKDELTNIKDSVKSLSTDINNNISIKLHELKHDFIQSVTDIFNKKDSNLLDDVVDNIVCILDKNNSTLIDKTNIVLNDILPKIQGQHHIQIQEMFKTFQMSVLLENQKLVNNLSSGHVKIDDYIKTVESRFNELHSSIQTPIFNIVNSTEERILTKINSMNEYGSNTISIQEKLQKDMSEILQRLSGSSNIGKSGENILSAILSKLFPTAQVDNRTADAKSGDFLLKRDNLPPILIENKLYFSKNVDAPEVSKFIRDCNHNKLNGIMLSQKSGIAGKPNWFIEFGDDHNIMLYVHNVDNDIDKIQMAVDIIDKLSYQLSQLHNTGNNESQFTISEENLSKIRYELKSFSDNHTNLIEFVKETHRDLLIKINKLTMSPTLDLLVNDKLNNPSSKKEELVCEYCREFKSENSFSMGAHKRHCKVRMSKKNQLDESSVSTNTTEGSK